MFDLSTKRHKRIQDDHDSKVFVYVLKKDELDEFRSQIIACSGRGIEGVEQFKKMFNVDPRDVLGYGDSTYNKRVCDKILQCDTLILFGYRGRKKYYKCFGCIDRYHPNRLVGTSEHDDPKDSWNCLMTIMGRPKNIVIVQIKTKQEHVQKSYATNEHRNEIDNKDND